MTPKYAYYWRYPENSFIYLFESDTNHNWLFEDFLDTLQSKVQLQEHHFPEYGMICFLADWYNPVFSIQPRYFIYQTDNDYYRCGEIFNQYAITILSQYPDVGITLKDWKARVYHNH